MAEQGDSITSTTQRAYTLRLRGADRDDQSWRNALWATHEAVNKGAKVFGDWLLTLRGGLDHALADAKVKVTNKPDRDPTPEERHDRRILLALSWLSVESAPKDNDHHRGFVVATGKDDSPESRNQKVLQRLRELLGKREIIGAELDGWWNDCAPSLSAAIRDDAVWVDRSATFDAAQNPIGPSLTREGVWDMLEPFFGSREAYLTPLASEEKPDEDAAPAEDKAKDLVQKAGQWLSSRFGEGKGANFERMTQVYEAMSAWAKSQTNFSSGSTALKSLATSLASFQPSSNDAEGILKLISGPGYKSATRNIIAAWAGQASEVTPENLKKLADTTADDVLKCKSNTGGKGRRPYSDAILQAVEHASGFTYLQTNGPARHSEFAVMLDHAARRVSIGHSWIKRAESERKKFKADAAKLDAVPPAAKTWLDAFCAERSGNTGAIDAYRIRKRAVEGWKEVVAPWNRPDCKTAEDRITAAREMQADPDIDKFGDIQLFEALAEDDALCVWRVNDAPTAQPLLDYAAGTDALAKQKRFKVPAYRHPDALSHPVFCDFGSSRWDIRFAVHDARLKLAAAKAAVVRIESELQKAQARLNKAKTPEKQTDAQRTLAQAQNKLKEARERVTWLSNNHAISMGLWDGGAIDDCQPLRWSCKRLTSDLNLQPSISDGDPQAVTRADRLGRAAVGASEESSVSILSVFDEKYWNGRLQAPRAQLDEIAAHIKKHGWDEKARKLRDRIRWLVSFSAKLQPAGPWVAYQAKYSDVDPARPFVSRKGDFAVKHETNDKRAGHAKLILSRLHNLRLLSVDLGHRYAAACAVWEAITGEAMRQACQERGHREPRADDLFTHLTRTVQKQITKGRDRGKTKQLNETTIYRRIAADTLADGQPHPAPWARLDRQFLIKLPGEDKPARAASNQGDVNEIGMVATLGADLGLVSDEDRDNGNRDRAIDKLMSRAVRVATLGLKRHARRAKIAYALDPATKTIPGMGGSEKPFTTGDAEHLKLLVNAIFDWHALATESKWNDNASRDLWNSHIATLDGCWRIDEPNPDAQAEQDITRPQRRKNNDALREKLKPIAQKLANAGRTTMHTAWRDRWNRDDGKSADHSACRPSAGFHAHLRLLTDWIMGRRLPGATSNSWRQNVGGLSLTRITTMKSLYQLHKAFAMRARPDKPRGAPEKGESNEGVAQSILEAMEKMREQRVKQLASRIAAAALGLGGHWKKVERRDGSGRVLLDEKGNPRKKRVWVEEPSPKYPACHAVVIENLTNYRPEETRTRRENRQLMSWCSSKVKKYLGEACQLHGLHLREVQAGYTSRQDSRTGAPGMRCSDVSTADFMSKPWWRKPVNIANKKIAENKGDARDRYLKYLDDQLNQLKQQGKSLPPSVRIPVNGGELFVSADPNSPAAKGLQADLNAAANIGLKALLDPDWPGKWWYVPYDSATNAPHVEKTKGSLAIQSDTLFAPTDPHGSDSKSAKKTSAKAGRKQREIINLWRDSSAAPVQADGNWQGTAEYWNHVRCRVIDDLLRQVNQNQDENHQNPVEPPATPW